MERKRKGDVREKRKGRGKSFPTKREKEDKKMGYFWPIQNKYLLLLHNLPNCPWLKRTLSDTDTLSVLG
jgi:hypothetical protein